MGCTCVWVFFVHDRADVIRTMGLVSWPGTVLCCMLTIMCNKRDSIVTMFFVCFVCFILILF